MTAFGDFSANSSPSSVAERLGMVLEQSTALSDAANSLTIG